MVNYALYIYELPLQLFKIFVLGDLFFVVGVITCLIYLNHNKINVLYHFSLDTYFIRECNWMLLFSDKFVDRLVYYFIFVWTYFSYLCFLIPGLLICLCFAFLNCIYLFYFSHTLLSLIHFQDSSWPVSTPFFQTEQNPTYIYFPKLLCLPPPNTTSPKWIYSLL